MKKIINTLLFVGCFAANLTFAGDFDLYERVAQYVATNKSEMVLSDTEVLRFCDQLVATNSVLFEADQKYKFLYDCLEVRAVNPNWRIRKIGHTNGTEKALCTEYANKFVGAGFYDRPFSVGNTTYRFSFFRFKLVYDKYVELYPDYVINHKVEWGVYTNVYAEGVESFDFRKFTVAEQANIFVEHAINAEFDQNVNKYVKDIMDSAVPAIRRQLRKEGKSFITGKDGVNPVQVIVDELKAALFAPRCTGVKEWVARWVPDYVWIDPAVEFMSVEEANTFKEAVFLGDKEFNDPAKARLLFLLGLDGYNEFVRQYNGE